MASLCFFRWPDAYAEAPFDTLFDTLPLLCITCPGAVGCCAMAGAPANAAKVPITARCLIIGHSFLCAPSITPAESQGFRRRRFSGRCLDSAGSVPLRWPSRFCSGSRVEHRTDKPELSDVFSAPCPDRTKNRGRSLIWKPKRWRRWNRRARCRLAPSEMWQ